jgi:hypothetical protein
MRANFPVLRISALALAVAISCLAQGTSNTSRGSSSTTTSTSKDVDSQIEALRADMRADKTKIVSEAMNLNEKESKAFWPVYRQYESDLASLNDQRVALIKEYAAKYANMTDKDAKDLLNKAFDFEAKHTDLKRNYADEFMHKGLSPTTTAKFFQLEHRLDALVDVKLASELPSLLVKRPKTEAKAK